MRILRHIILVFLLAAGPLAVFAENEANGQPEVETFDEITWQQLTEDADYFRKTKKKREREEESIRPLERKGMRELALGPLKYILLGAVIIAIAFVLLRVFAAELFTASKKLGPEFSISLDDLEEDLEDAPMQKFLKECMQKGDYTNAIRIYYLMILQSLNRNGSINWHKDKTNSHYLWEMRQHRRYDLFRSLTMVFERVWYGEHQAVSKVEFEKIEPSFRQMLASL